VSIEALSVVLNSTMSTDPLQKLILMGLANHADGYGRSARPSQETLARYAQCGRRTVQRKLAELEEAGAVRRGDQRLTDHLRGDRRPVVWDLCLRALHASSVAVSDPEDPTELSTSVDNASVRGATQTPREYSRGVTPDAYGASPVAHRTVPRTFPLKPPTTARDRRRAEQERLAELDAQRRELERAAARQARASAIAACNLCDDQGERQGRTCDHDPERGIRASRWVEQIKRESSARVSDSQSKGAATG